ncbi:hypothetical protein LYNGBM3L_37780 [Rivularia sp. IAM M-261]|nr:hypothetical protein LYNGBM3L_37780 [Rivularia sp. IAM M-261]
MMKKRLFAAGFAVVGAVLAVIPVGDKPAIAQLIDAGSTLAQNVLQQPKVNLNLVADVQQRQKSAQDKETISWKVLDSKTVVKPGDVVRFTLTGKNEGTRAAKNMAFTQAISRGLTYQLNSAIPVKGANVTYSIDQGQTFVANPTVKVTLANGKVEERPAPAEAYTHVRWNFSQELEPSASVQTGYLTKVR